jgi:hypothetical protein
LPCFGIYIEGQTEPKTLSHERERAEADQDGIEANRFTHQTRIFLTFSISSFVKFCPRFSFSANPSACLQGFAERRQ